MPIFYNDITWILIIPAMIIALVAQAQVKSSFSKYSKVRSRNGYTAADVARQILNNHNLYDVAIEHVKGSMTDHYDPRTNVVRLSDTVYNSTSIAAIGIAAHECGHAIQYAESYKPIKMRSAIVPITNIGSKAGIYIILFGLLFSSSFFATLGIVLFATTAVFQLLTLPVEFNASSRALKILSEYQMLDSDELPQARAMLRAAAMTYVAALISAIMQVLRLVLIVYGRGRKK